MKIKSSTRGVRSVITSYSIHYTKLYDQYGSDAIAGVLNVKLREAAEGGAAEVSYGWRETEYTVPVGTPAAGLGITVPDSGEMSRERSDGHVVTLAGWKGFQLGQDGFLTVTAEYKDQQHSDRSGYDVRQQYPRITSYNVCYTKLLRSRFRC